jgi:hypothetical protein
MVVASKRNALPWLLLSAAVVGTIAAHPHICGRCVDNLEGAGEVRRWF